jgi:hypothetical protein
LFHHPVDVTGDRKLKYTNARVTSTLGLNTARASGSYGAQIICRGALNFGHMYYELMHNLNTGSANTSLLQSSLIAIKEQFEYQNQFNV